MSRVAAGGLSDRAGLRAGDRLDSVSEHCYYVVLSAITAQLHCSAFKTEISDNPAGPAC